MSLPLLKSSGEKTPVVPAAKSPEPEKVRQLFDRLAGPYDHFNRCASLGMDRFWRRRLAESVLKICSEKDVILDLGTGTGDLIFDLLTAGSLRAKNCSLVGLDFSEKMLEMAGQKVGRFGPRARLLLGNAAAIPLGSGSVNVIVSAFTLRNVKRIISGVLQEARRVLVPDGTLFCLEMYLPGNALLKSLHRIYLKTALDWIGRAIFRGDWPGNYLAETIASLGAPEEFSELLKKNGFQNVRMISLHGGIAVLHSAGK